VRANRTLFKRFNSRYVKRGAYECWEWIRPSSRGYGELNNKPGLVVRAHVVAWRLKKGEWPKPGECVCHTCNNKKCVNPNHLYLATTGENIKDAWRDGLCKIPAPQVGSKHWKALLTEDQARRILRQKGIKTSRELGKEYGVSAACVKKIFQGKNWRHLHEGW